jgi:hypothetical protein
MVSPEPGDARASAALRAMLLQAECRRALTRFGPSMAAWRSPDSFFSTIPKNEQNKNEDSDSEPTVQGLSRRSLFASDLTPVPRTVTNY